MVVLMVGIDGAEQTHVTKAHARLLLAKIGLDGHDRGVKVLARSFRDAGIEVIYTGLWQTCEATMHAALQEDVDVVGVSLLSAAHMTVMPELLRLRKSLGIEHIPIVLGGIVPVSDHAKLLEMGVSAVFNPGSSVDDIIESVNKLAGQRDEEPVADLISRYATQDNRALARLISIVQRGGSLGDWKPPTGSAKIIGVTGSPGVGKSSFISRLGHQLRDRGKKVAVVAIDPSSPLTGGALLGDRLRMMTGTPDHDFFIRSLASGGVQGGLGPRAADVVAILAGFGFDYVIVETVGAGQSDVAIHELSDHVLLLLMPESGDAIQFSKAGIMEIAGSFVINKADLPGADATEAQLLGVIGKDRPVWKVSSVRDEGFGDVLDYVAAL